MEQLPRSISVTSRSPRSGHMGVKNQCFGCAAFNCFVARSDAVAEQGTSHMDVVNVRNAWMQFLTKLSGGATAMDGGSVDIERLYGYRR